MFVHVWRTIYFLTNFDLFLRTRAFVSAGWIFEKWQMLYIESNLCVCIHLNGGGRKEWNFTQLSRKLRNIVYVIKARSSSKRGNLNGSLSFFLEMETIRLIFFRWDNKRCNAMRDIVERRGVAVDGNEKTIRIGDNKKKRKKEKRGEKYFTRAFKERIRSWKLVYGVFIYLFIYLFILANIYED